MTQGHIATYENDTQNNGNQLFENYHNGQRNNTQHNNSQYNDTQ